ncbi:hypothetical protein [Jiangella alba]|uniref:Quinol monooxygenase YgiN n=1 Tax=Jiangella alba TaxID=561176 RepID=A0A1H5PYL0_9ACTN|nr:hypothetical protein [Jiangella alba]SEF18271.1 hypothetical protein SAMN04488561_6325 [Jiangella alba]
MSEPFIFVSNHRVKEGRLEELCRLCREYADFVEANEPRAMGFRLSIDDDGPRLSHIIVQPDAAAMDEHLKMAHERIGAALELVDTTSVEVYGQPGPLLAEALRHNADMGVPVAIASERLGGFARPVAA